MNSEDKIDIFIQNSIKEIKMSKIVLKNQKSRTNWSTNYKESENWKKSQKIKENIWQEGLMKNSTKKFR